MNLRLPRSAARPAAGRTCLLLLLAATAALVFQFAVDGPASIFEAAPDRWLPSSVAVPPLEAWAAPILSTPHAAGLQVHSLLGRAAWVASGSTDGRALAALAAALVVACAVLVACALRGQRVAWLPAAACSCLLITSRVFDVAPVARVEAAATSAFLAASLLCLLRFHARPRPRVLLAGFAWLALAVDDQLSLALLVAPAWWYSRSVESPAAGRMRWVGAVLVAAAIVHNLVATALTFGQAPLTPGAAAAAPPFGRVLRAALLGPWSAGTSASLMSLTSSAGAVAEASLATLGMPGLVLLAVGVAKAVAEHRSTATLLVSSLVMLVAVALGRSPLDVAPAALPLLTVASLVAGVGAGWAWCAVAGSARLGLVAILFVVPGRHALAVPSSEEVAGRVAATARLAVLAPRPMERTALVNDLPPVDRFALGSFGAALARLPRDADVARRFHDAGYAVVAFGRSMEELQPRGLVFTPIASSYRDLDQYLASLPSGALVALALPGGVPENARRIHRLSLSRIGGQPRLVRDARAGLALVGVAGAGRPAVFAAGRPARVEVTAGSPVGQSGVPAAASIAIASEDGEATIAVNGDIVVRSFDRMALVVIDRAGRFLEAGETDAKSGFAPRLREDAFAAGRVERRGDCQTLIAGRERSVSELTRLGAIGWFTSGGQPGRVTVTARRVGALQPALSSRWIDRAASVETRTEDAAQPGSPPRGVWQASAAVGPSAPWGLLTFGDLPDAVDVHFASADARQRLTLCSAAAPSAPAFAGDGASGDVALGARDAAGFGVGWQRPERRNGRVGRRMAVEAVVYVSLRQAEAIDVTLGSLPETAENPITLAINGGQAVEGERLREGMWRWRTESRAWRPGVNHLRLAVKAGSAADDHGLLGPLVELLRFEKR